MSTPQDSGRLNSSFWSSPGVKWATTVFLGVVFILAFLTYLAIDLVSDKLLNPQLYTEVLAENHIYHRVYTELLADPALEEATAKLLGNVKLEGLSAGLYSLATSTLYLVLPPEMIQTAVEGVITDLTSYLKGETERLEPRLTLSPALQEELLEERIIGALETVLAQRLASSDAAGQEAGAEVDLEALAAYAQDLSQGELADIPASTLASSPGQLSDRGRAEVADVLLGPVKGEVSPLTRLQVVAALAADDLPGAAAIAMRALLREQVSEAAAQLADDFASSEALDPLVAAAMYLEETKADIIARLNAVRDLVSYLDRRLIPLTVLIMALALTLIVWIHSHSFLDVLRSAGVTFLVAGGLAVILWFALGLYLRTWLPELFEGSQAAIPSALQNMIGDVVASLATELWSSVWRSALIVAVGGGVLIALSYFPHIVALLERVLAPGWPYRKALLVSLAVLIVIVPAALRAILDPPREKALPCNGHVELCDRPFNEITFAATHNSMSIADYGWLWPSHDGSVTNQLNSGIRAFLIDTHYYDAAASLSSYSDSLPPSVTVVAGEALDLVGYETREGTYLCHIMCGLGSTPLPETLDEIRHFLESHPREVVTLIIEDKITSEDTEVAFETSGLLPYMYTHEPGQPWPTLGQMIERGERLVVMAEVEAPPPVWYHHAWDYTEETPYSFESPEEFNCEPNRGGTDKPLFLLNHWIERVSPSRVDAVRVNEYEFLLDRCQQCAKERGQIPNFVAVNFYFTGDVVAVVDELNGVRDEGQPARAGEHSGP